MVNNNYYFSLKFFLSLRSIRNIVDLSPLPKGVRKYYEQEFEPKIPKSMSQLETTSVNRKLPQEELDNFLKMVRYFLSELEDTIKLETRKNVKDSLTCLSEELKNLRQLEPNKK